MNRLPVLDRLADSIVRRVSGEGGRRKMAQRRFHDEMRGWLPRSFQAPDQGPPAPEHLLRTTAGMTKELLLAASISDRLKKVAVSDQLVSVHKWYEFPNKFQDSAI